MNFGGTLVIRNMLKIALAILASLVKFQDCLHCLEARTDFVFFACNKHKTIVIGFYIFFQKNPVDTKFRSWLCFVKQFALWLRRDVFRHQHGEFFFPCSQPFVIPVHFWQVPALRAAAPGHVLFQSQPFFWVQHLCI
jgi:hypothetical protein